MRNLTLKKIFAQGLLMILAISAVFALPAIAFAQADSGKLVKPDKYEVPAGHIEYVIYVKTADVFEAGTDSNIYLTLYGDGQNGITINNSKNVISTPEVNISGFSSSNNSENSTPPNQVQLGGDNRYYLTYGSEREIRASLTKFDATFFERNSYHRINLITKDVGNITSVKIRKDNFGSAPDWNLEHILIKVRDKDFRFTADKWFRSDSNTHTFTDSFSKVRTYEVQTYTGDVSGAGTDSNIFLTIEGIDLEGNEAVLPEIRLNGLASGNLFERHQIDTIKTGNLQALRQIKRITIRSDNKYAGSAWYLGWINVAGVAFQVDDWIESGKLTKVLNNPKFVAPSKFVAPPNNAQTSAQTTSTNSNNVYSRPSSLTDIPPEIKSTPGLKCDLGDWVGTWNTTQGQLVINLEDGQLRVKFESNGIIRRGIPAAGNPCVFLAENIGNNRRIFQSHAFAMTKPGSFVGFVRTNFYPWSDGERWSGEKQNTSDPNTLANSTAQTNPSSNTCSATDWVGTWKTTLFPEMTIKLEFGKGFTGVFSPANYPFTANIAGNACVISGFWKDEKGVTVGAFRFTMSDKGNFAGAYVGKNDLNQDLSSKPQTWRGNKVGAAAVATSTSNQPNVSNPNPSAIPVNLSVGKFARQSSDAFGGFASRAVDGNTDGNWGNNSVTHTNGESGGWWEVDLGAVYNISEIRIFNRKDCCSDRLRQFRVSVWNEPFSSNSDGIEYAPLQGDVRTNPWTFTKNTQARYVRIYLNGTGVLSLAEVQVFGTPIN